MKWCFLTYSSRIDIKYNAKIFHRDRHQHISMVKVISMASHWNRHLMRRIFLWFWLCVAVGFNNKNIIFYTANEMTILCTIVERTVSHAFQMHFVLFVDVIKFYIKPFISIKSYMSVPMKRTIHHRPNIISIHIHNERNGKVLITIWKMILLQWENFPNLFVIWHKTKVHIFNILWWHGMAILQKHRRIERRNVHRYLWICTNTRCVYGERWNRVCALHWLVVVVCISLDSWKTSSTTSDTVWPSAYHINKYIYEYKLKLALP